MNQGAKETRPTAATVRRAMEPEATNHENPDSGFNPITTAAARQIHIVDYLSRGQENAVPLRHLKQMTGIPGRELRRMIKAERKGGTPILSNCKDGYFLPDSPAEVTAFVKSMRGRAREILLSAAAVEKGVSWWRK